MPQTMQNKKVMIKTKF